jgi:hypothetical protein
MAADAELRHLLIRVAAGDLDPSEAARLLDQDQDLALPTVDRDTRTALAVIISAHGVRLNLVADPIVATAVAEGPHQVREESGNLVFELPGHPVGSNGEEPGRRWGRFLLDLPYASGERVTMRVNPALAVRLDMTACDVHIRGLRAPLTFGCFSGSLHIADHHAPLTGTITTGSAKIEAELTGSSDSLTCDMSSLKLTLLAGSDTTVSASAEMGSLKVIGSPGADRGSDAAGIHTTQTAIAGAGSGRLALSVRMGSAKVLLP